VCVCGGGSAHAFVPWGHVCLPRDERPKVETLARWDLTARAIDTIRVLRKAAKRRVNVGDVHVAIARCGQLLVESA
jgi:hypothetical protein